MSTGRSSLLFAVAWISLTVRAVPLFAGAQELPREMIDRLKVELRDRQFSGMLDVRAGGRSLFQLSTRADISTRSVFWVGSVSKQFAAVATLKLVERGKLSLERPFAEQLGLSGGALCFDGVPCTLEQVLHHTSGLPPGNVCSLRMLDDASGQDELLRCVRDVKLKSRPGTRFVYSNLGYDLVGVLVSRAAGMRYSDFLKRELFAPLALGRTGVDLRGDPHAREQLVQGEAFNGAAWSRTWPWLLLDPTGPGTAGASGNVFSCVEDLHAWNRALHGGRVLSPASYVRLVAPALDDYGLGVAIEKSRSGTRWILHSAPRREPTRGFSSVSFPAGRCVVGQLRGPGRGRAGGPAGGWSPGSDQPRSLGVRATRRASR